MVHKHIDAYKHEREARRRAYMNAPSLKDRFPAVEQLVLELTFVDPRASSRHSPQTHIFGPGARGYFEVACPFSSCTGGGFDLSAVVADLLSHGDRAAVGKLVAERAIKAGVKDVVFDRGGYLYHGRVKALADAAREAGLNF